MKNTNNFETALEAALHARITVGILRAPKTLARVNRLYEEIRQGLFDVVHKVHVLHATAEPALLPMAAVLETAPLRWRIALPRMGRWPLLACLLLPASGSRVR